MSRLRQRPTFAAPATLAASPPPFSDKSQPAPAVPSLTREQLLSLEGVWQREGWMHARVHAVLERHGFNGVRDVAWHMVGQIHVRYEESDHIVRSSGRDMFGAMRGPTTEYPEVLRGEPLGPMWAQLMGVSAGDYEVNYHELSVETQRWRIDTFSGAGSLYMTDWATIAARCAALYGTGRGATTKQTFSLHPDSLVEVMQVASPRWLPAVGIAPVLVVEPRRMPRPAPPGLVSDPPEGVWTYAQVRELCAHLWDGSADGVAAVRTVLQLAGVRAVIGVELAIPTEQLIPTELKTALQCMRDRAEHPEVRIIYGFR